MTLPSRPPEGNPEMSVRCFEDVMKDADTIIVDENIRFWIASELRSLLSDEHRMYYVDFINSELSLEDNSKLVQHLVTASNNSNVRNYSNIRLALQNVANILSA